MKITKILLSLLVFLLLTSLAWALSRATGKWQGLNTSLIVDSDTRISANSLDMYVLNQGNFAYDKGKDRGKNDGLYYPKGYPAIKNTVIYDAGLWVGAKVNNQLRVAVAEYSSEFAPGPMKNGTYQTDAAKFKVYEINRGDNATKNPDYANWPVDQGAPVDSLGNPALLGDQLCWSACTDADPTKHINNAGSTSPLGIEVQQTTFAFARGGALGTTIFVKFKFINKGGNRLDSTYVSLWADPDLGDAASDLVGCDTSLSLGYCYNAGADETYGAAPPAVGFDFFQGPVVPGAESDTAHVSGKPIPGYKNLPMTSFNKYINGTDPASPTETYNYMKGLNRDGTPVLDNNNVVTTYSNAGDPVTQTGWIDAAPADRRYMMSAGPFTMNPGDTQEVVAAVIVGQGSDPLNSIQALKTVDRAAQAVFDLNFDIPLPPPSPAVYARGIDGGVDLTWGDEPVGDVQISKPLDQEFHFEGYNLYQGASAVGPWKKFATYDNIDDNAVALIYGDVVDANAGGSQRVIMQKGANTGLLFHQIIRVSNLDGSAIKNNQPYYFAVTAYSYDYKHIIPFYQDTLQAIKLGDVVENLESPIIPYPVKPMTFMGVFSDTADHSQGESDGQVFVDYIYPDKITGHTYEVGFNEDLSWKLTDLDADSILLDSLTNQSVPYQYPVKDGIMVRVTGLPPGIKGYQWVGGTRWLTGEDQFGGNLAWLNGGLWNGPDFFGSNIDPTADYVNVEIRFSKVTTQKAYDYARGTCVGASYGFIGYFDCPFTIWDVTSDPPRQLNALFVENCGQPTFDSTWFPGASGVSAREYLFIMNSTYSETINPDYTSKFPNADAGDMDILYALTPKLRDGVDPAVAFEEGQKLVIQAAKPNLPADHFTFKTVNPASLVDSAKANNQDLLAAIKTVPNPYYDYYGEETDQFGRIIKFIDLPPARLKIRIFNIAGDLLRTMEKTDIFTKEFTWDLKTDRGLWVASGVYVWLIEADGIGTRYGKMAVFTEVEQLNTF